jgi:hypothetical protein
MLTPSPFFNSKRSTKLSIFGTPPEIGWIVLIRTLFFTVDGGGIYFIC